MKYDIELFQDNTKILKITNIEFNKEERARDFCETLATKFFPTTTKWVLWDITEEVQH